MTSRSLAREIAPPLAVGVLLLLFSAASVKQASGLPAGFQEFYLPLPADRAQDVFRNIHAWGYRSELMHYVVGVTASADNTVVYYDHWEVGGLEGPGAAGYDEVVYLDKGETYVFESSDIPSDFRGTQTCYDGGDRIYVAGGLLQLVVSTWPEALGTVFSDAWEVYPVQAWNTQYVVPVGEDLGDWPYYYDDFDSVWILVMSGTDGNAVTIDGGTTSLNRGQTLAYNVLTAGTTVESTHPVQVQLITGQPASSYEMRGYTITPRQYWGSSYYAPVPSWPQRTMPLLPGTFSPDTDLFLYNPNPVQIVVNWQHLSASGWFYINPGATRSFQEATGQYVPVGSGVHLSSSAQFWGIASCDTESSTWDWGYSLIPEEFLGTENYLSWAPGTRTLSDNGSPAFITAVSDDTTVFIDYAPNDGVFDTTILDLDRLETIEVYDPDLDNTGMHIVSTAPVAVAWGESPLSAGTGDPYLDMGYTCLPLPTEWMNVALEVDKSAHPAEVGTGEATTFTIVISVPGSADAAVTGIDLVDALPPGWEYVAGSGSPSDPAISGNPTDGYTLTWNGDWDLDPGESRTVTFDALATPSADTSSPNRNVATAAGRSLGVVLTADDDAFVDVDVTVAHSPVLRVTKTGPGQAGIGDEITYTITVLHDTTSDGSDVSGVSVIDDLAGAASYMSGDDGDGILESGEVWVFTVDYTIPADAPDPLVNTASCTGTDKDGDPVSGEDDHSLDIQFSPVLLVDKTGPSSAGVGDTVTYTITVQHDPSSDRSDVDTITLTDTITDSVTYITGDDGDGLLEYPEVWTYQANYTISPSDPDPLINTATAEGLDLDGETVSDSDDHNGLDVGFSPVLLVDKTGPSNAGVGDTVTYTITVQHDPSSDRSDIDTITLTDTITDSITYITGDDGDGVLEYPEIWTYHATYTILPGDPDPLVNTATAQGLDLDGQTVSDSDDHSLRIFKPDPPSVPVFPAAAASAAMLGLCLLSRRKR